MKGQRPDFVVKAVTDLGRQKSRWKDVGVGFWNKDRESLTILLDAVPLSGKLVLMRPKEREGESPEDS